MHANTYITVLTRNVHARSRTAAPAGADAAPYIGVIGSRRRWEETKKAAAEDGMADETLARIHSPIGLDWKRKRRARSRSVFWLRSRMARRGGDGRRLAARR